LADVGDIGDNGARLIRSFVVQAPRQFGKALLLQDRSDSCWTERLSLAGEGATDIMDRQVLFPQCDDLVPQSFLPARGSCLGLGPAEELTLRLVAKLMGQDSKTPRRITKTSGCLSRGKTLDKKGSQGFVLAMGGIGGLKEPTSNG
jgi:hypothetical protein